MRCAIYTRKSVDEARDVTLSTIDNQHAACIAFVDGRAAEGWTPLAERFDDRGASGATLERPALARLRVRIAAGMVEVVLVHKLDRIARSMRGLVRLLEEFEAHDVRFVSVTQQIDTSGPMGRLMLNVMMSFAEFERELIGERTRAWKAGARSRGLWTSGPPPFGYEVERLRLRPHPERAGIVRAAYRAYPRLRSLTAVADGINRAGHRTKLGRPFSVSATRLLLTSRVYRGELVHRGDALPGTHEPIVSEARWQRVQDVLRR